MDWDVNSHLLARIAHILAGANWQRAGGKGQKPRPIKPPDAKQSRKSRAERGQDTARRLRNLGLLPGHTPPSRRTLTPQEAKLADQLRRAREKQQQQDG